jgi:hypothetical protein
MHCKVVHPIVAGALAIGLLQAPTGATQARTVAPSGHAPSAIVSDSPDYSDAMRRLLEAAQKLRDAANAMAMLPPGRDRDRAIQQTNEALLETQKAMFALPIELRYAPDTN